MIMSKWREIWNFFLLWACQQKKNEDGEKRDYFGHSFSMLFRGKLELHHILNGQF
jgi:hypothetical protein